MKNVTLSLKEDLLKASRECAVRRHTTLNQMIRDFLETTVREHPRQGARELFASMDASNVPQKGYHWRREDAYS